MEKKQTNEPVSLVLLYAFVHLDVTNDQVLTWSLEGKSLANAMVYLKHHPCKVGAIYEYDEISGFNANELDRARQVAIKRNGIVERVNAVRPYFNCSTKSAP